MKKGLLIILSGPSGVGKGTVRQEILKNPAVDLYYSVSLTTRGMRPGETDGREYYFVTNEEFDANLASGNLLEWNQFVGNRYGTPKDKVEAKRLAGHNVLLEIDVNGATQVLSKMKDPGVVSIFLAPPSFESLEARIRGRSTESEDAIQARLEKARLEVALKDRYDYVVVNDTVEQAAKDIEKIIFDKIRALDENAIE